MNLKFVHVYPHIVAAAPAEGGEGAAEEQQQRQLTPEEKMLRCDMDDFERLLDKQLPTYAQKKRLLDTLKSRVLKWNEIDEKVRGLKKLSAEEQAIYDDDLDLEEVQEKDKKVSLSLEAIRTARDVRREARRGRGQGQTSPAEVAGHDS